MSITWRCTNPDCRIILKLPDASFPFRCKCGARHEWPQGVIRSSSRSPIARPPNEPQFLPLSRTEPCIHRGAELRTGHCPTCRGNIQVKVFGCSLHGECTIGKQLGKTACCAVCRDYTLVTSLEPPPRISAVTRVRPAVPGPKTIIVLGAARGGTTFAAELLHQIGVDMGDLVFSPESTPQNYDNYEDQQLAGLIDELLKTPLLDHENTGRVLGIIEGLARERDAQHLVWGFKRPQAMFAIDRLLPLLRNPHIVVMLRDPVAVWQSDGARNGWTPWQESRHSVGCAMDLLEKPRAPTMAISYERGMQQREHVRDKLRQFAGWRPRRNLLYHVCPLVANDLWERNVDQVLRRIDVFDGSINIAVSTGDPGMLLPVDAVRAKFKGCGRLDIAFIPVRNDRRLREVASFPALLQRVAQNNDQVTFYAHTKGNSTACGVQGATYWRNTMYHELLDKWEHCMRWMGEGYKAVGCNKMVWGIDQRPPYPSELRHGHWMFAGTFFWFRHDAVFGDERWSKIPNDRYGAEAWLSGMMEPEEAKSVFQPWPEHQYPTPDPYNPQLYIQNRSAIEEIELLHPAYEI